MTNPHMLVFMCAKYEKKQYRIVDAANGAKTLSHPLSGRNHTRQSELPVTEENKQTKLSALGTDIMRNLRYLALFEYFPLCACSGIC